MVRDYELMYIIRPELDDEAVQASIDSVDALIASNGGEVVKTTPWGKRRLAFEVKHMRDGHYVLAKLKLDGDKVTDVERTLRISDTVFRHLLVLDEGTPDDESGVPGRPSREPRAEGAGAASAAPAAPLAVLSDDDDDDDADDDGDEEIEAVAPAPAQPVAVAAGDHDPEAASADASGDDTNEEKN